MDQVLADTLKANLKSAATPEARQQAQTLAMIAVVDCQFKTSERVKKLAAEKDADRSFWNGARWVGGLIQLFITSGGAIIAIKICKVAGILW